MFTIINKYIPLKALLVIMTLLLCASCSTHTKIEYRDRVVDNYITQYVHDTLRESTSDSVSYELITRNETVFATKYKEKIRWRDRIVETHDTCWKDSIVTEYKETIKETKYVPRIYKISLAFSIFVIIFVGIRLYLKFKGNSFFNVT